jgi:hypothetical protein
MGFDSEMITSSAPTNVAPLRCTLFTMALWLPLAGCGMLHSIERSLGGEDGAAQGATAKSRQIARPGQDFYKGKYSFVRIETSEAGSYSALPLVVDDERLSAALTELRGSGADFAGKPLFSKDELTELVPVLKDALAQAHADQDVVFAITGKHSSVTLFESESVTTGRMFVADGRLQLIFGMTRVNFGDELRGNHTLKTFVPGTRARALASASPVSGPSWTVQSSARPDWVSLNFAVLTAKAPAMPPAAAVPAVATDAATKPITPRLSNPAAASDSAASTESEPGSVAERRLITLQRLRQKGLISEQEFQEKRRAVVDGL